MKCLRAFRASASWSSLGAAVLFVALGQGVAEGAVPPIERSTPGKPVVQREQSLRRVPVHSSEFAPIQKSLVRSRCGKVRPPEALLTPDPVIQNWSDDWHVQVSFVIGVDGRVHSAFIVRSGSPAENQAILRAVRRWRYRPGLCNGVPTDVEARVSFAPR